MKKITLSIAVFIAIFLLYSCGGVIGNMEKYRFTGISLDSLKAMVDKVYLQHPEFRNFDSIKYKEGISIGDGDYYCRIKENGQDYIFQYAYPQYPSPNDTIVEIALTSAANYGGDLKLERDIRYPDKVKYRKFFEKYFIEEIRKELKKI